MEFTAEMIAGFLGGEVVGDPAAKVNTIAKIEEGKPGALSFLSNPKYEHFIYDSDSTIVIVNKSFEPKQAVKATMIKVDDAYACFAKLLELYEASKPKKTGISEKASISESATLGENCYVGDFAVIGDGVKIGDNCQIYPQVYVGDRVKTGDNVTLFPGAKIYGDCVLGNNVTVNSNSTIGADGFGWAPNPDGTYSKIPQLGNVILEDNVDIGANTCVDRATMGSTVIKKGVKLDNLIQVGHNCVIGHDTVCAAQAGIAGSSKVGSNCMIGGQVGITGHITIGDRVKIGSKSGVSKNVPDNDFLMGYPSQQIMKFNRSNAVYRQLPELSADVHKLKKQMLELLIKEK